MAGPRVLILYSRTGGGHGRVAQTLRDHLQSLDPSVKVNLVDGLEYTDLGIRVDPARAFLTLTTTLIHFYNLNYRITNTRVGVPLLRALIRQTSGRTLGRIVDAAEPDLVISTHHFISPSTIAMPGPLPPMVMVVSDLGEPHRVWFDPRIHTVYVPSEQMAAYARRCLGSAGGQPAVETLGFPIDAGAIETCSPDPETRGLLVMGGGAGTGGIDRLVETLLRGFPDHRVVVVCGWNHRLKQTLEAWGHPNLVVHGFVTNVPELMSQSDMVISKAGPVTIMEAVAAGRPLVITDWVGLQERDNVRFVEEHGLGLYAEDLDGLTDAVRHVYANYQTFVAARPANIEHGPDRIAEHILGILQKPGGR